MINITQAINSAEPEHRVAIHTAWINSDGTIRSLEDELNSMLWECPDLDVSSVIDMCHYHKD
jgi:hypothetical protein